MTFTTLAPPTEAMDPSRLGFEIGAGRTVLLRDPSDDLTSWHARLFVPGWLSSDLWPEQRLRSTQSAPTPACLRAPQARSNSSTERANERLRTNAWWSCGPSSVSRSPTETYSLQTRP